MGGAECAQVFECADRVGLAELYCGKKVGSAEARELIGSNDPTVNPRLRATLQPQRPNLSAMWRVELGESDKLSTMTVGIEAFTAC